MCCVCGMATSEADPANVERVLGMLRSTRPRGPDGCGLHAGGTAVRAASPEELEAKVPRAMLGARILVAQSRLAITGDAGALPPFASADGNLALAHNGEVYNHRELATLLGDGPGASTGCDSEVLLRVLELHHRAAGGDLVEAMRRTVGVAAGMYALAATDGKTLVLARDAIGKKPLYYVHAPGSFAFASERKALAEVAGELDAQIQRVEPGLLMAWTPGGALRAERVEHLAAPAVDIVDPGAALQAYRAALDQAIRRRTRGLARAAVFFSGGVDSVLVARLLQREGVDVTGYVAGVDGSGDVRHALEVGKEIGLPVHATRLREDEVEQALPSILAAAELHGPVQAEVSVPMWFAARAAHGDGHRVVFTGQAADELFAGYDWYRDVLRAHGPLALHARMWEDLRALPLETLEREDRISMAWSLENRAPFLDADVIRAAMRISPALKIHGPDDLQRKHPHRTLALEAGVPASVARREKSTAQDGSHVHELLASIARRRFPQGARDVDLPDFGSNYRYRHTRASYTTPEVRALLAAIAAEHGFVVARQDGSAVAPPRIGRPALPPAAKPAARGQPLAARR